MPTVRYTTVNGRVIAEKRNGVRKLYRPDHLGSTIAMYDNTQTKTDTWVYWPYGAVRTRTGSTPTSFQFVGVLGYFRDSSDRTYVRARTYRQTLGNWQTRDPLWPRQPEYGYLFGSPTRRGDPSGLLAMTITMDPPRAVKWPDIPWQNVGPWIIGAGEFILPWLGTGAAAIGTVLGVGGYIYGVGEALDWSVTINPAWEYPPYPLPRPGAGSSGSGLDLTLPMFILPQLELVHCNPDPKPEINPWRDCFARCMTLRYWTDCMPLPPESRNLCVMLNWYKCAEYCDNRGGGGGGGRRPMPLLEAA